MQSATQEVTCEAKRYRLHPSAGGNQLRLTTLVHHIAGLGHCSTFTTVSVSLPPRSSLANSMVTTPADQWCRTTADTVVRILLALLL